MPDLRPLELLLFIAPDIYAAGSGSGRVTVNTYVEDALSEFHCGLVCIRPLALEPCTPAVVGATVVAPVFNSQAVPIGQFGLIVVQFVKVATTTQPPATGWSYLAPTLATQSIAIFTVGTAWLGVANRTELAASARTVRIRVVFFI
jgi:hypothetical protein